MKQFLFLLVAVTLLSLSSCENKKPLPRCDKTMLGALVMDMEQLNLVEIRDNNIASFQERDIIAIQRNLNAQNLPIDTWVISSSFVKGNSIKGSIEEKRVMIIRKLNASSKKVRIN